MTKAESGYFHHSMTEARHGIHLFVYGTLLSAIRGPAHEMLARGAEFAGTAYFQGRLYDLGRFPGAVASARVTDRIIGELYRLRTPAILLADLDSYEGQQFHREKVTIFTTEGNRVASWIYLLNHEAKNRKQILLGDYAAYLRRR